MLRPSAQGSCAEHTLEERHCHLQCWKAGDEGAIHFLKIHTHLQEGGYSFKAACNRDALCLRPLWKVRERGVGNQH